MKPMQELSARFTELMRLNYIDNLLEWDQQVCMPHSEGSIKGRSELRAVIGAIGHEKLSSKKTGKLIKRVEKIQNLDLIDSALLREAKRKYEKAVKIPTQLVTDIAKISSLGQQAWEKAKTKSDFGIFKPYLEKMIQLKKEYARRIDMGPTLYDSLIDIYEPGARSEQISKIFGDLLSSLKKILRKIEGSHNKPDQSILKKHYDAQKQLKFSEEILKKLNFDFTKGRQDESAHPFTSSVSSNDTRITTRISENYLPACLFGTIHECGHALYEMGFMEKIHDTFLADGSSLGIHESQSRLWENLIGRSKEFWNYWYPILQQHFPENLKDYPESEFYRSINVVKPSLIRVEADEITYGLHIILRFELEKELINNDLSISELPDVWNEKMEEYLKVVPPDDAQGVLQDIHWSGGAFGYFPTYTLGNLYASQIYADALKKNPHLPKDFQKGDFSNLLNYLRKNVHQYGRIYRPLDLIKKLTGEKLNPIYFIKYLEKKFYPIYGI
ncbi:MAG: carboxypeptidase M32 [Promethearchaeota archaeon]|nr:MAG: carboxypeptidase M32 [Candidatus Lokiarchaeota archaeon]